MSGLLKILLGIAEVPLLQAGEAGLDAWLEKSYAKNPKRTATLVCVADALLKGEAEELVKKTANTIDDDVVKAAESELEAFATRHNFKLSDFLPSED